MLENFEIKTFKKFSNLKLENLSDVNIFLGRNNVGKTTILESLFAFACGENLNQIVITSLVRGKNLTGPYDFSEKLLNAFYNKNVSPFLFSTSGIDDKGSKNVFEHTLVPSSIFSDLKPNIIGNVVSSKNSVVQTQQINVNGGFITQTIPQTQIGQWTTSVNGKKKKPIDIAYPNFINGLHDQSVKNHKNARFVDIINHRDENENRKIYALLKRESMMKNFVDEFSKVFGEVNGIDMLPYPDGTNGPVSIETDRGMIPLSAFGDGLQRYFNVIGGLFLYRDGIHCIEEVDATFHPEAQESFSRSLLFYSSLTNNQIFMSSHSAEFVDNFLRSVANSVGESGLEKVRVITLKNTNENGVRVRTLTGVEALIRRNDYEMELR